MSSANCHCSICLNEITTGKYSMACQHSFHYRCITNWFIEQNNKEQKETCPYCRREASEDEALPKIDELSVNDESESDAESEDQPPSELLKMSHRLSNDLHSLEDFKRLIQTNLAVGTATETQQGILNCILAHEVDLKDAMQKILDMEEMHVWRQLAAPMRRRSIEFVTGPFHQELDPLQLANLYGEDMGAVVGRG
jgi:hypothetical protein